MQRCYWCGQVIKEGEKAYSLGIFSRKKRIFCSRKCRHSYRVRKRRERRTASGEQKRQRLMLLAMILFYVILAVIILHFIGAR